MANIPRKSDGRRIFTDAFKREQMGRVWRGEVTLAQLGRKLGIAQSLLQRWKHFMLAEAEIERPVESRATSPSEVRAARHVHDLLQMVSKQKAGLNLLRAELDALTVMPRPARASGR